MRVSIYLLTPLMVGGSFIAPVWPEAPKGEPGPRKPSRYRLNGMKAAVADIEAGKLNLKFPPGADPAWQRAYAGLLEAECGVSWETVHTDTGEGVDEAEGYDDVMTAEIEHRSGKGIVRRLRERATAESSKAKPGGGTQPLQTLPQAPRTSPQPPGGGVQPPQTLPQSGFSRP